ncbi:hypothetical protein OQA88_7719 [Cercophora sp. LCS_1]
MATARSSNSYLSFRLLVFLLSFILPFSEVAALPAPYPLPSPANTCRNLAFHPFDYAAKLRRDANLPVCPVGSDPSLAAVQARDLLLGRQVTQEQDYSCSETRPCRNGACCPKATGWCNYGPEACGTNNISPNDVCWSNCDAKADCGRYADPPGKECPLNVCCGPWGYCGMTEEFCTVDEENEEKSCQSNCEQPGSGASGGNVRKRVIGYYEAWVHARKCNGMSIEQIPAGALTHLMFSFGYITPGDFKVVPMDDLDPGLFSKMTALKRRNKALKVMIALGGWTFNDPGPTQQVFSQVASTQGNRATFITNLLSFMRQYAFDGVDFDWEYPGADDRGGQPDDAENFTKLLEELRAAIKKQPVEYVVSFTTPTSYWYLRHFDIKASTDAVDFVNIMSYDLHGVWDAWNPIGSHVLAHSNLTEIKLALDLYWRNDIPPDKLNLGIGFYGRSFELADPACSKPGCIFKGGAAPGSCTANSGTLAYREIVDIIKQNNLKPYYEEEHQIKYIVWNQNQWVSYDDAETIKAKIDFANNLGLGGLLIWSIDQDTDNLEALSAVVGPQTIALAMRSREGDDAAFWQDIGAQSCYTTECGGSCRAGFKKITQQPCGGATFLFRHSDSADSLLCCPLTNAPDPDDCTWRGGAPSCNGRCHDGEAALQLNRWGDGAYCEDGNKVYCCAVPQGKNNDCYWSGMGQGCRSGDQPLTFAGTFLSDIADVAQFFGLVGAVLSDALNDFDMALQELYCCPPEDLDRWKNCEWKGKPGSCFDNHCDLNTEVQLATNRYGFGQSCSPRLERARVFCCDPPDGENLFLPVPLEDLFPNPPTGDDIDTDFDLNVDNTWGDGVADTGTDDDPDEAAFQFYVMASPDEIQISLDKRDGSHWEVFNCNDPVSEEEQTVQMICTDVSENSNCDHIYRGKGVEGTILEMPKGRGCGPGKYAVAKSLVVAQNQTLPRHLAKRSFGHKPVVYDLTFGYDFSLVPREFGETQLRVDFSNQEGYWDNIVAKPHDARKRRTKRTLADVGGNHRRWLEEEWRDDLHYGALSREELHKRWFGSDVLSWIQSMLHINIKKEKRHDYEEDLSVIILQEQWSCKPRPELEFSAKVDAIATAGIKMSTSFGFTLITTLDLPLDLTKSFVHFNNEGEIEAIFTLDALAKVEWDSGVKRIATLPLPGASFRIPGIVTIGPHFNLDGRFKAGFAVQGRVEARVTLASWEIQQTYPEQGSSDRDPEALDAPKRDFDVNGLQEPTFDVTVDALGYLEAHLMPTLSFGIDFDEQWNVGKAAVELIADGYVRLRAKSNLVGGTCGFGYGVDVGAVFIAQAVVPDHLFDWRPTPKRLGELERTVIPSNGDEYLCLTGGSKRSISAGPDGPINMRSSGNATSRLLSKRLVPYGPIIRLPKSEQLCPNKGGVAPTSECSKIFGTDEMYDDPDDPSDLRRRDMRSLEARHDVHNQGSHWLEARDPRDKESLELCTGDAKMFTSKSPKYDDGSLIYDNEDWSDCNNYEFGIQDEEQDIERPRGRPFERYITEHVLEWQLLKEFMATHTRPPGTPNTLCKRMLAGGWSDTKLLMPGETVQTSPWVYVGKAYPGLHANHNELNIIPENVNLAKERVFKRHQMFTATSMANAARSEDTVHAAIRNMKTVVILYKYLRHTDINTIYYNQAVRVGTRMNEAEDFLVGRGLGYVKENLQTMWLTFMSSRTTYVRTTIETFLTTHMAQIEDVLEGTDEDEDGPDRHDLREKIQTLRTEVDNIQGTWNNPF